MCPVDVLNFRSKFAKLWIFYLVEKLKSSQRHVLGEYVSLGEAIVLPVTRIHPIRVTGRTIASPSDTYSPNTCHWEDF